jgi:hypothetical protein
VLFFLKPWRGERNRRWRYQMIFVLLLLWGAVYEAFAIPEAPNYWLGVGLDAALLGVATAATYYWWSRWKAPGQPSDK